jgi:deoxyribodipyrimidine photo-lyase
MKTAIVWFRKDLRLHDHEALHKAKQVAEHIIPFYCFDASEYGKTSFGFDKTGPFRTQFNIESVAQLRANIRNLGNDLYIRAGNTADELAELVKSSNAEAIFASKDIHAEEISIQKELESKTSIPIDYSFSSCLYHVNDLSHSFHDTPEVFTTFRKGVEKKAKVRELFPKAEKLPKTETKLDWGSLPSNEDLGVESRSIDLRAAIQAKGGEDEALKRLAHYFFETRSLQDYKQTRNGLLGEDYSSKFSLWLWNGCISPRMIYWKVKEFEKEIKKNQSTYWLIFELIWRDYFKYISLKHGNKIFQLNGIGKSERKWEVDHERFQKWAKGETGIPFIDANMRELNETGFMSNRGRQNVASFLSKELQLDWRMGAEYFESMLIDYDVASNYGNWMYVSGVGNDPRDRYFNIISQAKRYDPQAKFVKHWLPELNALDASVAQHPWTANQQLFSNTVEYPKPMVEPEYWKKYY